ncbi:PadR family transcriptional regulator [Paenibacillus hexagrammi]|uniref:PadR family transcriptional regulator n=1 Tax=Paenibacillus hexagrammi TaxID=2908839 RepID=A0ABY3SLZ1_9BACL|nr:PadR family transcriptional regulator [Paenibacillus sp. YPD9-1]UJF34135.1 PadR family transcriptional regulator [Paenibacillus sp. YPD9-1]
MNSQDVILGVLMKRKLSGYDIKQLFETIFSYFYNASFGTIYPTLAKMEKEGLISKESIIQEGKPNKNVFTITEEGKRRFAAYIASPITPNELKSDFMMRMFFGEYTEADQIKEWLELGIQEQEAELHKLREDYKRYKPGMSVTQEICIRIGLAQVEATLLSLQEGYKRVLAKEADNQ